MAQAAAPQGTLDPEEAAKFARIAAEWWDPKGKFAPLHRMNPVRLAHVRDEIATALGCAIDQRRPFQGLRVLDAGCGGGLASEPLARLGAAVTGLDAADESLNVARAHAKSQGLSIDYRCGLIEDLATERPGGFDAVVALEIVEHVADLRAFIAACAALLRPGGVLVVSTINRTPKAFALAIVAAERLLRWTPPGSHHYEKLVAPAELAAAATASGLAPQPPVGLTFEPLSGTWRRSRDVSVNYVLTALKPAA